MQFTVPKFIEDKPKIVGPLTFQQFIFVGTAGVVSFFLYFIVPLFTFIIATTLLLGIALSLAFIKIQGIALPIVVKNLFVFVFRPRIYLWKRKAGTFKVVEKEKEPKEKEEEESVLKISKHSRLKELSAKIETGSK